MIFNRKSVWTMCALVALNGQPVQAMEELEKETKSLSLPKPQNKDIEVKDLSAFKNTSKDIQHEILLHMFISAKTDTTNFREIGITLSLVCKDWNKTIAKNAKKWVCEHFNIDKKDEDIFWPLFKGNLTYKPDPDSDKGRIDLFISSLSNPLRGEFDLSKCGKTGEDLSINVGYREGKNPKNAKKIEIWVAPWFLIKKNLSTTATHFEPIMADWSQEKAQVGMFWTWGGWDNLDWYDYLTKDSMDDMGAENLLKKYKKSRPCLREPVWRMVPFVGAVKNFTFCL